LAKTSSRDLDVLVIGGGASGLWAAIAAARAGARTAVVERCSEIGERIACAEGVSAEGLAQFVSARSDWVAAAIDGACLVAPDGAEVRVAAPGTGYVLHKQRFLRGLAELAAWEGVDVRVATEAGPVRLGSSGGLEVSLTEEPAVRRSVCRVGAVVGADGVESRVGREAGIQGSVAPGYLFLCAQYTVAPIEVDPHVIEFHFGNDLAPGGYAWVFPKGDSAANVGVGVTRQRGASSGRAPWVSPVQRLVAFKQRRAPRARELRRTVGGIPIAGGPFKACSGGIFLAGDALRIADPLTGGGIVPGMASGALAGAAAARWARGDGDWDRIEGDYSRAMRARFKDRRLRVAARKIVGRMTDRDLTRMIDLAGDYATTGDLTRADPLVLLKFMTESMPVAFGLARRLVGL
jgi:digeranylgeranylglycerophospholipid reductase